MDSISESLKAENLSLGGKIQDLAIDLNNSKRHPVLGFIGGRAVGVILKPPARITDVALHIILAVGKTIIGVTIVLPVQFVAICLNKKFDSNWSVKQSIFHIGFALIYAGDTLASPLLNLISPNIYLYCRKKKQSPAAPSGKTEAIPQIGRTPQPQPVHLHSPHSPAEIASLQKLLTEKETALSTSNQEKSNLLKWAQQKEQQFTEAAHKLGEELNQLRIALAEKDRVLNASQEES